MCLKVIRPRIISCLMTDSFSWLRSFISIFFTFLQPILYFWVFLFLLSSFSFFNLSCFHLHIPTFCRGITELFFLYFPHLPFNIGIFFCHWNKIQSFIFLKTVFLLHMPPSVEGDPWSGFKKKIIKLKGGTKWIIFYNSERIVKDGRLSSQRQSPNWRVVP